jgi:signal transduction histidine kinase
MSKNLKINFVLLSNRNQHIMPKKYYALVLLIACLLSNELIAQTRIIDSLRSSFYGTSNVTNKQEAIIKLCENASSLPYDSILIYLNKAKEILPLSRSNYYHTQLIYADYLTKKGKTEFIIPYCDSLLNALMLIDQDGNVEREIIAYKVSALIMTSKHKDAISLALHLLSKSEQAKDTVTILRSYSLLGWAHMELENHIESVRWLKKGLAYITLEHRERIRSLYNNLASSLNNANQRDSAFYYIKLGLENARYTQNLTGIANALNIRAAMYLRENNVTAAGNDLEEALQIREKYGDIDLMVADMAQLSSFYASSHQYTKGIELANKGYQIAQTNGNLSKMIFCKLALAENYKSDKKISELCNTQEHIIALKDSLYKINSESEIADMTTKYELQNKENIIIQQENKLIRSRYTTYGSLILLFVGSIIGWLLYRNYRHRQQRKLEILLSEEKIQSLHAVQFAEEKERIAADLHDNLGSYAAAITSNIRYLKDKSQTEHEQLIEQLDENAQGIVTQLSDSIWVLKNEHLPITKLADRFKSWAQRMIQNYPHVKYDYEEHITEDIEMPPAKILNLFLILKECLTNSLKHSDCNTIKINFQSDAHIKISIEDNGKGFQTNLINRGNGIDNIKHRAKECGLHIKWESLQPSGTRVSIDSTTTN